MKYEGEIITKTLYVGRKQLSSTQILISRNPYPLEHIEFVYLTDWKDWPTDWQRRFLFIAFGLTITIIGRVIYFMIKFSTTKPEELSNISPDIKGWEIWSCLLAYLLFIIFWLLSKRIETEKTKVKDSISHHFINQ